MFRFPSVSSQLSLLLKIRCLVLLMLCVSDFKGTANLPSHLNEVYDNHDIVFSNLIRIPFFRFFLLLLFFLSSWLWLLWL